MNGSRFQPAQRSRRRKPGEPRHQVELRRPGVPAFDGVRVDPSVRDHEVMRGEPLRDDVVHVERQPAGVDAPSR